MKLRCIWIIAKLFITLSLLAQKNENHLHLNTGTVKTGSNLSSSYIDSFNKNVRHFQNKTLAIVRFQSIPDHAVKSTLALKGTHLDNYLSDNSYVATLSLPLKFNDLTNSKIISVIELKLNVIV